MGQEFIQDNTITTLFSIIIVLNAIIPWNKRGANERANTSVALGILGTFSGVYLGLYEFDVSDIQGSVPKLLDGLKTAFVTSIFGLLGSLLIKFFAKKTTKSSPREMSDTSKMINILSNIERAIAGEGETTIVTQIQKLRTSNVDELDKLNKSFVAFAEKLTADSTQSLIEALENVIQDFNNKISEQFGENFKHLNEGVGKMLEWQNQYSNKIEVMTDQFRTATQSISHSEKTLNNLTDKSNIYIETALKLDVLLSNLNTTLAGINEMSNKSKDIFPIIKSDIKDLTEEFSKHIKEATNANSIMLDSQRQSIGKQLHSLTESYKNLEVQQDKLFRQQEVSLNNQVNSLSVSYESMREQQNQLINEINSNLERIMQDNATRITEQLASLDEELAKELNKALTSLGSQLTSLSSKFVEDYTPLTKQLRKLIQVSNSLN